MPRAAERRRFKAGLIAGSRIRRHAPKGFRPPALPTTWMRVPWSTLVDVDAGHVSQLRVLSGKGRDEAAYAGRLPIGVVLWSMNPVMPSVMRTHLFTVTENRLEPVGAATPEDIRAEGFADRDAWRRSWMELTRDYFDPLQPTEVFVLRAFHPTDIDHMGRTLVEHLYGHHLDGRRRDQHVAP